jgi:hypothetical protein
VLAASLALPPSPVRHLRDLTDFRPEPRTIDADDD